MSLDTLSDVNYLAVLVGAVAYFVLGGLWYSPVLFAKPWMAASGIRPQDARGAAPLYILSFVLDVIIALALAFIAREAGASTVGDGIVLGLVAGIGLALPPLAVTHAFESRPRTLQFINLGYHVVAVLITAVIVTVWD